MNKNLKIAITANGHIPSDFAHSINTVKHANAFRQIGCDVELLTIERICEKAFKLQVDNLYDWYGVEEFKIIDFKDKSLFYFYERYPYKLPLYILNKLTKKRIQNYLDPQKEISNYIKKQKFNLCFARSYRVVKYNIENKIPTIMEIHNYNPKKNVDILNVLSLAKSPFFKGLVTIHERLKKQFIDLGVPQDKIIVLDDAVDLAKFEEIRESTSIDTLREKYKYPKNKKIITYIGQLYRGRGIEYILESAKVLSEYSFLIVGGKIEDVEYYKKVNIKLGNSNVEFIGQVPNSLVPEYAILSDILVMPYTRDIPTWEHMSPIKLFEYLATGKPIIGTNLPAIENVIKDNENGVLVEEKDSKGIVKAIKTIIDDKKLINKIKKNNLRLVQDFSYKKRCEKILNTFIL